MGVRKLVVLLLAFVAVALATSQTSSTLSAEQRLKAVTAVRVVNTAEANYFGKAKRYGSLDELNSSGSLSEAESMFSTADPTAVDGFAFRVVVSDNKKGYQISVTQVTKPFSVGFFSDERGLIYEGRPLQ
jgi:type II secretory pathway pseudopilin PulG